MMLAGPCRTAVILVCLVLAATAGAGEVRRGLMAPSRALGRDVPCTLYLPDGYDAASARYPVLFLLHGLGGNAGDWADGGRLGATLDRLITVGAVPPMLIVAPGMGDSWYADNPDPGGFGAAQTVFLDDLVPFVDAAWRTTARREGRAVAGLSMGGWGAVRFATLRPDLFVAAASLSGAIITEDWAATPEWAGYFTGAFGTPVDLARFRAASPFTLIPQLAADSPRPALYFTCGNDDELDLVEGNLLFHLALERAGIHAELRIADGARTWDVWARELDPVLRFVGVAFAEQEASGAAAPPDPDPSP
jgi:S-formylglutathione hydrolase FrmB